MSRSEPWVPVMYYDGLIDPTQRSRRRSGHSRHLVSLSVSRDNLRDVEPSVVVRLTPTTVISLSLGEPVSHW